MQKPVANIITNSNKIDFEFKYNKCKSLEEIDVSLPTLIIGYNNAKRYIKNFNILNKAYPEQKIWWTFLKTEKRVDYERTYSAEEVGEKYGMRGMEVAALRDKVIKYIRQNAESIKRAAL